ncbi:hypothetical protein KRMM14A1004_49290 [Krasilnikovia sp. MM14-A1004]
MAALVVIGGVAAFGRWLGAAERQEAAACQQSVHEAEGKLRTDRWDPPSDLPDLGNYPEIHWQAHSLGCPCSRAPGPTDFAYQGVVRLKSDDAARLTKQFEFVPFESLDPASLVNLSTPAEVWPELRPHLPSDARWLYSESYDEAGSSPRWRSAFLDLDHQTLLFMLNDH